MESVALKEVLGEPLEAQAMSFFANKGLDIVTEIRMFISKVIADSMPEWEYRMQSDGTIYRYAPKNRRQGTLLQMTVNDNYKAFNALEALKMTSQKAIKNGSANISLEEINKEIYSYRESL
ncbi:MAG: hypothetical protein IJP62_07465 [Treponema sp.]|nr:hypothetical protein [Treponema sp.]